MRPLPDAVAAVRAAVEAGEAEGVPFVLNARTDAFLRGRDRDRGEVLADAIERGRAFLDAGAACVFVPGLLDEPTVGALVEGIGERRVSVINVPGSLPQPRLAELGVARVSFGPFIQRAALTALAGLAGGPAGRGRAAGRDPGPQLSAVGLTRRRRPPPDDVGRVSDPASPV